MSNIDDVILTNTSLTVRYVEVCKSTIQRRSYRTDIDGLRGISIFFVISGFLVYKIIFKKIEISSFSFIQFYSISIKQIFPELIITLAVCIGYGWFVLFADEFTHFAKRVKESNWANESLKVNPLLYDIAKMTGAVIVNLENCLCNDNVCFTHHTD